MRIIPGDAQQTRPVVLTAGSLPAIVRLSTTTKRVRAGAPLRPTPAGWEVCPPGERPWLFAADYKGPGDEVTAWREVIVDLGRVLGTPGTRLVITDIADDGGFEIVPDEHGPYVVTRDTYVLFTRDDPGLGGMIQAAIDRVAATIVPTGEPDYRNNVELEPPASDFGAADATPVPPSDPRPTAKTGRVTPRS